MISIKRGKLLSAFERNILDYFLSCCYYEARKKEMKKTRKKEENKERKINIKKYRKQETEKAVETGKGIHWKKMKHCFRGKCFCFGGWWQTKQTPPKQQNKQKTAKKVLFSCHVVFVKSMLFQNLPLKIATP